MAPFPPILAAAGASRWTVSFSWPASPGARAALVAVFAAAVAAGAYSAWRAGRRRRYILPLRLTALALLAAVVLRPSADALQVERVRRALAVLLDDSLSMRAKAAGRTRADDARAFWRRNQAALERIAASADVVVMRFGRAAETAPRGALTRPRTPSADASRLRVAFDALEKWLQGGPGRPERSLCGVVLASDGAVNDSALPPERAKAKAIEEAKRLRAPFLCVLAGRRRGEKDIAVRLVSADAFAFVRNAWTAEAEVSARGYPTMTLPVTLYQGGSPVATKAVTLGPDRPRARVRLTFAPRWPGRVAFTIAAPVQADEALAENNAARVSVQVARDKIRVLHVCGRPSWDVRFLRRFLKKTPNVDLISFFILREANEQTFVPRNELSLIEFPTHKLFTEELNSFDVVIFQNFDYRPYDTGPLRFYDYLENIRRYVRAGGAFVMIGGDLAFSQGGYARSPLADILPVKLDAQQDRLDRGEFRPVLTAAGRTHPLTQLASDPEENAAMWGSLPALQGCNVTSGPRPGAVVLAEHPSVRVGGSRAPIIAVNEAGAGRVLAVMADSTWRWGFLPVGRGGTNLAYLRFWRQALLWLTRAPELQHVRLTASRDAAPPGARVSAVARVTDSSYRPEAGRKLLLTAARAGGGPPLASQTVAADSHGAARIRFTMDKPGVYVIRAVDPGRAAAASARGSGRTLYEDEVQIICRYDAEELADLGPDEEFMKRLAKATGGWMVRAPGSKLKPGRFDYQPAERVVGRRSIPLWDNTLCLGLIAGLLCIEWWLRRRSA